MEEAAWLLEGGQGLDLAHDGSPVFYLRCYARLVLGVNGNHGGV